MGRTQGSAMIPLWAVKVIVMAAAVASAAVAWQRYVAEPYRAQGRAEMQPALNASLDQLKDDKASFDAITGYMRTISDKSAALAKAVDAAARSNANRRTVETTRVEYIDRIVPSGSSECERVTDAIAKGLRK